MKREESWARLGDAFDVVIIGGGATGLGSAVEAASRGLKVALVDSHDFAHGTSSRSTKLVHGGVRYLAHGNFGLVREALRERARLRHNAPHLVGDLEFVVPAYAWWAGPYYGAGLKLYDLLAGRRNLHSSRTISRDEVIERIPNVQPHQLRGGILYHDGQFDDARLAIALAQTASDQGAVLINYAPVVRLLKEGSRVAGVVIRDGEGGREQEIRAKAVVNATGVFADAIRQMDEPDAAPILSPSQGIHLVLPSELFPGRSAIAVPKTDDGRVLFIIPWHGRALLGTTDTPVEKVSHEPRALEEEILFLLRHAKRYLATAPTREDVVSTYVGLRPLVRPSRETKNTGALSRDHALFVSESGLITIVGGKWTTYRKMGEDTIDSAIRVGALEAGPSLTASLRLRGAPEEGEPVENAAPSEASAILASYGTDAKKVAALAGSEPDLARQLHPRLPYIGAMVVWAVREEMARTVEDVLSRRTRALLLDARAAAEAAPGVARLIARELHRDDRWIAQQVSAFRQRAEASLLEPETAPSRMAAAAIRSV
jgi:glycerol-3-phosphate dehydrogenase